MNWYKRYIGDYQRDTGHLTMVDHGAYCLLLDIYYATAVPLPLDRKVLYRMVRATERPERRSVDRILTEFWQRTETGWVNKRAEKEIARAASRAEINRENASSGSKPPSESVSESVSESPRESRGESASNPDTRIQIPESRYQNQKPEPDTSSLETAERLADFLWEKIKQNNPKANVTKARLGQWAKDCDRMLRVDGRTEAEIRELIIWSQQDDFWRGNILSMHSLRKQFDRLTMQSKRKRGNNDAEERFRRNLEIGDLFDARTRAMADNPKRKLLEAAK